VVEAVQQRYDEPGLGLDPAERRLQTGRLGGDDQHIDRAPQHFGSLRPCDEIAHPYAPDADPLCTDQLHRRRARKHGHVLPGTRKRRGKKAADATGSEHGDARHSLKAATRSAMCREPS
jgi:hypothetical protein